MKTNRRDFLKLLGISSVAASAVSAAEFDQIPADSINPKAVEGKTTSPAVQAFSKMRELVYYEVSWDKFIVQVDAYNGQYRLTCSAYINPDRQSYSQAVKEAKNAILVLMEKEGWGADSLVSLPIPRGYVHPLWAVL